MSEKILNQAICLKQYISEREYKEINQLEVICSLKDKTNLKLELDYKVSVTKNDYIGLKEINEYLYYVEDVLVAYLGISSFGGNNGEINGMTHPDFRRKGLFTKLFKLATEECQKRNFNNIFLLSDGKSRSGNFFIKAVCGKYDFSEYRMKLLNKTILENINSISLRKAEKTDKREIARQNAIFFYGSEEGESFPEEEEIINMITYMIELNKAIIGKIRIEYSDNSAFICGFGILPNFRGKGYGKKALKEVLRIINEENISDVELDVESKNNNALNLYKACGFEEMSVMNYYRVSI
ncbi:GNAT family N-acetyltransferase [Clostridium estertheticum]|uniref:GNAT family N-acetyltransferase n=1 Tax=Clostridium estertheticum TaxID=238834 RepID=UPI001CF1BD0B|nr:GNAT family N-acetyltransferase [Clostridium estertheticum]MCB2308130.1 GNAT family N-acetyltransferase [Clostridium estertheticum]MCB2346291.1 GNAT family N-acetyltransferase [Clostridium estertheticum]MCB2349517.1 GNAT family N-acetyltransferase [Clostridium estertheticum]WAG46488.1 GNAT family N-acetyltransferase [Clostridium estertheticum]